MARALDVVGWRLLAVVATLLLVLWWTHGLGPVLAKLPFILWFVVVVCCLVEVLLEAHRLNKRSPRGPRGLTSFSGWLAYHRTVLRRFSALLLVVAVAPLLNLLM